MQEDLHECATKEDWLKPLLTGPLRSVTRGWVFTMAFRIVCYFQQESLSQHVLDMLLHCYIMKEVEGNDTRPLAGVEQQESPRHHFKIPYIRYFLSVANRGGTNSSTGSVNQLTSSLFISLLKLRTYSK